LGGAEILNMGGNVRPDGTREKAQGSVLVKLQSGEVRRIEPGCVATVGTVSKYVLPFLWLSRYRTNKTAKNTTLNKSVKQVDRDG